MNEAEDDAEARAEAAYTWATGLVELARTLSSEGTEVDLQPIRPAVHSLCDAVKELPPESARSWVRRLLALQGELAALGQSLADRTPGSGGPL